MKKTIILSMILLSNVIVLGQTGINTSTPSAALDIVSKGNTNATKALEINKVLKK